MSTFAESKPMLRPTGIHNGSMKINKDDCTSCGLCIENCPFKCLEMGEDNYPKMKAEYVCLSCHNCTIPCPTGAISAERTYYAQDSFFDIGAPPAMKLPLSAQDADGKPVEWTEIERLIFERRSVRNFKPDPVPDTLIRRVLEAGRFAPSGGNHQPWKFAVITDQEFIGQIEGVLVGVFDGLYQTYSHDETAANLVGTLPPGFFDPRTQYGLRCTAKKELPVFLNAPVVIFLGSSDKCLTPELNIGICGQNMNLAAVSLGLGFVWAGFGGVGADLVPAIKSKLGFEDPWRIITAVCLGYPSFKQTGMVPRHSRPVTWFRPGAKGPEVEE